MNSLSETLAPAVQLARADVRRQGRRRRLNFSAMFPRVAAVLLATVIAGSSLAAQSRSGLVTSALPTERAFPLEGSVCGCAFFAVKSERPFEQALLSTTPSDARAVVQGTEQTVPHVRRARVGAGWINTYKSKRVRFTIGSTKVPFAQACAEHSDPPPHGSCYVGKVVAVGLGRSESVPVVGVCGC
jgi:hypothetical protein